MEGGEFENQPVRRTDVIREEDRLDEQELPEIGELTDYQSTCSRLLKRSVTFRSSKLEYIVETSNSAI